jgi:hypothetical protein
MLLKEPNSMATRKLPCILLTLMFMAAVPQLFGATTVTLDATPTPAVFGASVALTATITPGAATGRVTFFDGVQVLGSAPIAGGIATLNTVLLATGSRNLSAYYPGDGVNDAGTSNVFPLVVTPAAATLLLSGVTAPPVSAIAIGNFDNDNLQDMALATTNDGKVSIQLGTGAFQSGPDIPNVTSMAVGDFNEDGNADLAVVSGYSFLTILLGNGNGTFASPAAAIYVPPTPYAVAVGDFNADGKADLVVSNLAGTLSVYLGDGDGTFDGAPPANYRPPVSITAGGASPVLVADFNNDGKADIATLSGSGRYLTVIAGNGDGTFQTPNVVAVTGTLAVGAMASEDLNADAKADLVLTDGFAHVLRVLLGNGDGTFAAAVNYAVGNGAQGVALADLKGNGKFDAIVANLGDNTVGVLPGNGDGTFGAALNSAAPAPTQVVVADVNHDGKADVAVASAVNRVILAGSAISLSVAAGTPQSAVIGTAFTTALGVTVEDNGNPVDGAVVTFTSPGSGASAVLSSNTATTATGGATVTATANNTVGSYNVTAEYLGLTVSFALTNTVGAAGNLAVFSGSIQNTGIGQAFPAPLKARVTDAGGNPVSGVAVTFTPPASGASATLSGSTATTDSNGIATVSATANSTPGNYAVVANVGVLTANFVLVNTAPPNSSLTPTAGTPQSTVVGTGFPVALQVTLKNSAGAVVPGVMVSFSAPSNGASASLTPAQVMTNANGVAATTAIANSIVGAYQVSASVSGLTESPLVASFSLTNTPGTVAAITVQNSPQSGVIGTTFTGALIVTVKDAAGNPKSGVTVTFTPPSSGASAVLSSSTAVTNNSGVASVTATANGLTGSYTVTVSANGVSASFALNNIAGPAATISASAGSGQSAALNTAFSTPLQVTVRDGGGSPMAGVTVTFTAPSNGAGANLSSAAAVTNGSGVASVTATANGTAGSYSVTARVAVGGPDIAISTTFSLTNTGGTPPPGTPTLTATGGTPQSAMTGAPFSIALQVRLSDGNGNPVAGSSVIFAAPASGASATIAGSPAVTDATGRASVTATANAISGTYLITASSGGLTAAFTLTNTAVQPGTLGVTGGNGQSTQIGTAFTLPLQVTLKDALGNTVNGGIVTFTVPASGASAVLSNSTASTNGAGVASVTATANGVAGSYQVVATVSGLSAVFQLTNTAGANANLATGKPATQSSTLQGASSAVAGSAVDGNTDGAFFSGSVTHTNEETSPWWQVDLQSSATVTNIKIFNRTDCCGDRLSDFWVFVSDTPFGAADTPATLQARADTFSSHQTAMPSPSNTITVGAQGRYVRVQLAGVGILSLAEIQVNGTAGTANSNLASGKGATQSSNLAGAATAGASSAVDNNTNGNFFAGSVTHTAEQANPWWQVDLGASSSINTVTIYNRTDCCSDRLMNYWVFVSENPFTAAETPLTLSARPNTFSLFQAVAPSPSTTLTLNTQGRYVRIQLAGSGILSLAEVQVNGTSAAVTDFNVALNQTATQSSTLSVTPTPVASLAVDGATSGAYFAGSVTHTGQDANAWWQVDLASSRAITSITVWNRTDCCSDRLSDYWIFVSDTPFTAADTAATLQTRAATTGFHQTSAPGPSTTVPINGQGRYVRVQLAGTNYLSLAEVQVTGH